MKMLLRGVYGLAIAGLAIIAAADSSAQEPFGDAQVMIEFQRAADSYAFGHRQTERRGTTPVARQEGAIFTPVVAAAFRARIRAAVNRPTCDAPRASEPDFVVLRVNASTAGSQDAPSCIATMLPGLPTELEYRVSGIALLLIDAHLAIVVDVLHAAFAQPVVR